MPINQLRSINTFAKTAALGSFRQAAAAQGITPQAASQALAQLEKHLGVRLFHRTTRNMAMTAEGRQFLESAQPALLGPQRAMHMVRRTKDEIAGPLRIAGPRSTFLPVLWPLLEEFCKLHPERSLFPLQLIICAAPAYLARHGAPDNLNALASHRCSVFRHPTTGNVPIG